MRLLWVKASKLFPIDTGGKIRSYSFLRYLMRRHDVTFLSSYDGPVDAAYEQELRAKLPGSIAVTTGYGSSTRLATALRYVRKLPSPAPFAVTKFTSPKVQARVAVELASGRYDVAICDFLAASLSFPPRLAIPSVLFQHNVESMIWDRQVRHETNPLTRAAYFIEAGKMRRYEPATVRRFHHVIAVSEHDRTAMSAMTDPARITVVPTGVDVAQYRPAQGGGDRPVVLFLGSMDWEANVDGVTWFCESIWPAVRAAVPEATFRIVGRDPHPRVRALAGESVEVTGSVPSVIGHLHDCAVFVVPLRVGGGTRIKIYEAMASAKAVVSTAVGAEGLDVTPGRDILVADTAAGFAQSIITLLEDRALRARIEDAGLELASRHDWTVIAPRLESMLESVRETPEARITTAPMVA